MRTNVTATSLAAHDSIIGSLTEECHRKIASVMEPGIFYTRKQIAYMLNMETSSVAGRVNRMIELEVIEVSGQIRCPVSGRMVEAIKLAPAQKDMF
jgi:Mn-dependent DtxR family transcriptional regulator